MAAAGRQQDAQADALMQNIKTEDDSGPSGGGSKRLGRSKSSSKGLPRLLAEAEAALEEKMEALQVSTQMACALVDRQAAVRPSPRPWAGVSLCAVRSAASVHRAKLDEAAEAAAKPGCVARGTAVEMPC